MIAPFGYDAKGNQIANAQLSGVELKQANLYMLQMYRAFGVDTPTDRTYAENIGDQLNDSFDGYAVAGITLADWLNADGLRLNETDKKDVFEEAEYIRRNPQAYRSALDEAIARAKAKGNLTEEQKRIIRAMEMGIAPENIVLTQAAPVDKSQVEWSPSKAEEVAYSYGEVLYAFGVIDKQTAQACQTVAGIRRSEEAKRQNVTGNYLVDAYISPLLPRLPGIVINELAGIVDLNVFVKLAQGTLDEIATSKADKIRRDPRYQEAVQSKDAELLMQLYEEYKILDDFAKYLRRVI